MRVQKLTQAARGSRPQEKRLAVLIAIDVENAFNSAPWTEIVAALEGKGTPTYIGNIVKDYVSDR